jgi:GNAT superfamily N-acetyltransferase
MPHVDVRPFRRADRDHVTALVNRHAAAVLPGVTASVNAVLSQFEREPGESVVDPWVGERLALVAQQAGAVVAAALVVRYRDDADVGPTYRNSGDIRWLVFHPAAPAGNPYWEDGWAAARALMAACLDQLLRWEVASVNADGALPVPAVYGVPEQWPHVARLYEESGFVAPQDALEIIYIADLGDVATPDAGPPGLGGLRVRRSVGINGTRFSALLKDDEVGYLEVEVLDGAERHPRLGGLADIGNLHVAEGHRRRGIATWLLAHAADWLRLGHVDRLLHYATPRETAEIAFVVRNGFVELTRTRRGWTRAAS